MRFFPVVERELRVLARSRRVYWGRFSAAQIALAVVAWVWFSLSGGSSVDVGKQIFTGLSYLIFGYCLIVGIFLTVGLPPVLHDLNQFSAELPSRISKMISRLDQSPIANRLGVFNRAEK